jgi:hypothetical protein
MLQSLRVCLHCHYTHDPLRMIQTVQSLSYGHTWVKISSHGASSSCGDFFTRGVLRDDQLIPILLENPLRSEDDDVASGLQRGDAVNDRSDGDVEVVRHRLLLGKGLMDAVLAKDFAAGVFR